MFVKEISFALSFLVILHLNIIGESQMIGEEKRYAFVEQVILERVRSTLLEKMKDLEKRVRQLEEKFKTLREITASNPTPVVTNGCPSSEICVTDGLVCPRFRMDQFRPNVSRYLSTDNLTLSNEEQGSISRIVQGHHTLAKGSRVITNNQTIYFEVEIYYRIKQNLSSGIFAFMIVFATTQEIDNRDFFNLRQCVVVGYTELEDVSLLFLCGRHHLHSERISDITPGTEETLTLGVYINREDKIITVFDISGNKKVYTFTDVDPDLNLCPVFGVTLQSSEIEVRLRLNTQTDITTYPCGLV